MKQFILDLFRKLKRFAVLKRLSPTIFKNLISPLWFSAAGSINNINIAYKRVHKFRDDNAPVYLLRRFWPSDFVLGQTSDSVVMYLVSFFPLSLLCYSHISNCIPDLESCGPLGTSSAPTGYVEILVWGIGSQLETEQNGSAITRTGGRTEFLARCYSHH